MDSALKKGNRQLTNAAAVPSRLKSTGSSSDPIRGSSNNAFWATVSAGAGWGGRLAVAGGIAAMDGPLPFGDIAALGALVSSTLLLHSDSCIQ